MSGADDAADDWNVVVGGAVVAGRRDDDQPGGHGSLGCLRQRVVDVRLVDCRAERQIQNAYAIEVLVVDRPIDGVDDVADAPRALVVEHPQVDQVGVRRHARIGVDFIPARPPGGDAGNVGPVSVLVVGLATSRAWCRLASAIVQAIGLALLSRGLDAAYTLVLDEIHADDHPSLQVIVVGDAGIDDGDADAGAGHAVEPERAVPGLVGADCQMRGGHGREHDGVGRQVGHVRVPGQGVELPAGHLEHTAAPQMTLDRDVVTLGQTVDLGAVAIDDDLHRLV